MAKSSVAPQDRVARARQREDSSATVREQTREAVSPDLDRLDSRAHPAGHRKRAGGEPIIDLQRIESAFEDHGRKFKCACTQVGRGQLYRVQQVLRRALA